MEAYFPAQKIVLTGNPVRKEMSRSEVSKIEAINFFKLDSSKKTILVIGGSLGARAINQALIHEITKWKSYDETIQVLWQCGKLYYDELKVKLAHADSKNIYLLEFIQRMDLAYAAADLVVSRAGALSVSELCLLGKASILVPSPNVAEDHQTKNAMALVRKDAAVMLKDDELKNKLISKVTELLGDENAIANLSKNSLLLAKPNATEEIVDECEKVTKQ
jgi:UDP-N-acetylglucosamine--N-acetylmuramyl-(pentapeptide) pyrophosphoryl-undecaprenol N-acetylglucosamine transferase